MRAQVFRKAVRTQEYARWEAAGLRWLGAAGAAPVVEVIDVTEGYLNLRLLHPTVPSAAGAEALGTGLALMHAAGAASYGCSPPEWSGDGFLGPTSNPLPLRLAPARSWGEFFAAQRIQHTVRMARDVGALDASDTVAFDRVAERVAAGVFDTDDRPARIHGDLWSGNIFWTKSGAVLIDPAAHGGHREADLAMLALFGAPHLERLIAAYDEAVPLADGWRDRVGLHQIHPVLVHAVLFGGDFGAHARALAERYS